MKKLLGEEYFLKIIKDRLFIRVASGEVDRILNQELPPMMKTMIFTEVLGKIYSISYSVPLIPTDFYNHWNFNFSTINPSHIKHMLDAWKRLYPGWVQEKPILSYEQYDESSKDVGYEDVSHLEFFSRIHALLIEKIRNGIVGNESYHILFNRFDSFYRELKKKVHNTLK